jgi:uncharacterized protein
MNTGKPMLYGLTTDVLDGIRETVYRFPEVEEVWLFGSRAMGNFRNGSDIDLALKGPQIQHNTILRILVALDDLWLPYKFDVLHYERVEDKAVREHIDRHGILLKRPDVQVESR